MGVVELWVLYALAVAFTVLRTYARISAVGFRRLQVDDYLVWVAILIYTAQCSLGYSFGVHVHGLANDGMTPNQRNALLKDGLEYNMRVTGSKIQVAGWTTAACLLWSLKLCVAIFYLRLTERTPIVPHRARHTFQGLTFDNESEEDMVTGDDVIIHRMQETSVQPEGKHVIVVLNEYCVTSEDRCSARSKASF